jgi:hypothetical protein
LKCASPRADDRRAVLVSVLVSVLVLPLALEASAGHAALGQSRGAGAPGVAPRWFACAGGSPSHLVHPVRRLTAIRDKAIVEPDISRVFAQREKEQRISPASLAAARLSIDFLYAAGEGSARIYYYEASKTIPDAEGLLRVSVSGWLRGDGAGPRSLGSKSELLWLELSDSADGEPPVIPEPAPLPDAAAALVPLGVLGHASGHVWVMRRAIGNGTVLIYDVGPAGVRLRPAAAGKGC